MSARTNGLGRHCRGHGCTPPFERVWRPGQTAISAPSKRGAGESASSTPAQHWARQAAWSLAAWALWRTWRGVAQSTHGSSQLHTPARTPVVADSAGLWPPDPPSHTRAIAGQGWSFHKHRGRVGWLGALGPRGGHQQAAKQSLGENEGVRLEPPPPWTQQLITPRQSGRGRHSISTALTGQRLACHSKASGRGSGGGPCGRENEVSQLSSQQGQHDPLEPRRRCKMHPQVGQKVM